MSSVFVNLVNKITPFIKYNTTQLLGKKNYVHFSVPVVNLHSKLSKPIQLNVLDKKEEKSITENVLRKVNETQRNTQSRLFAVVHICGKQFKITTGDVIIIEGYWPPDVGEELRLDKVLCAGGADFSLFGTPLIQPGLVNVHATVIEKSLSHTKTHFRKKRRKQYMRINFFRYERTALRINEVTIGQLKETVD